MTQYRDVLEILRIGICESVVGSGHGVGCDTFLGTGRRDLDFRGDLSIDDISAFIIVGTYDGDLTR